MIRQSLRASFCAAALLCAAGDLSAQVTHTVNLSGFSFTPNTLTVNLGDTVNWVWVSGQHNVASDVTGIFRSGAPALPPKSFAVTFDANFINTKGVSGNVYGYHCEVHGAFGMTGTVTVANTGRPVLTVTSSTSGTTAMMQVTGASAGGPVGMAFSTAGSGPSTVPVAGCGNVTVGLSPPFTILPTVLANGAGTANFSGSVPPGVTGAFAYLQAMDVGTCRLSNGVKTRLN